MKKKVIIIGDPHGWDTWKKAVDKFGFPREGVEYVFLGDYFDSFTNTGDKCIDNFKAILDFKRTYPSDVTLIYGNHDHHYVSIDERYSGYNKDFEKEIVDVVASALKDELLVPAYKIDNNLRTFIFSHAGFSKSWYQEWFEKTGNKFMDIFEPKYIYNNLKSLDFYRGDYSYCGRHVKQGPLWIRPSALMKEPMDFNVNTVQIVGHTPSGSEANSYLDQNMNGIVLCDCANVVTVLDIDDDKYQLERVKICEIYRQ